MRDQSCSLSRLSMQSNVIATRSTAFRAGFVPPRNDRGRRSQFRHPDRSDSGVEGSSLRAVDMISAP